MGATLPGKGTDQSHYLPTWKQLTEIIGHKDFLFLADCKGSTWANRAQIDHEGGIYCFPLAMSLPRPKLLCDWVANPPTEVTEIFPTEGEEPESPIGKGFEVPLGSLWDDKDSQSWYGWSERWLVVCSYALRSRQIKSLENRLKKAQLALKKLALKPPQDAVALQTQVDRILKGYRVTGYILTSIDKKIRYNKVYEGGGRQGANRSFRRVRQTTITLSYQSCQSALASFQTIAGWRLYVTNAPKERLSLEQAVLSDREGSNDLAS